MRYFYDVSFPIIKYLMHLLRKLPTLIYQPVYFHLFHHYLLLFFFSSYLVNFFLFLTHEEICKFLRSCCENRLTIKIEIENIFALILSFLFDKNQFVFVYFAKEATLTCQFVAIYIGSSLCEYIV